MWTITHPSGSGTATFEALGLAEPQINFRVMGVSTARVTANRDLDSADLWWVYDSIVTIYQSGNPYFTGRVQECPDSANPSQEVRTLALADAWQDLAEVIYRELWGIGSGSYLYPRCILGRDAAGENITTGAQIGAVIDYAITQGVALAVGDIDEGMQLWPSEARNASCEAIITNELQFHPDWVAWIDHSAVPPVFHARAKASLDVVTLNVASELIESQSYAAVKRTVPNGVSIIYESAVTLDGEIYREGFPDEVGATTGRRVIRAMFDLEGVNLSIQKTRIQTRTMPTSAATMTAWMKLKFPELAEIPSELFSFHNFNRALATPETAPAAINPRAAFIEVPTAADIPRELVNGAIEDWMRVKVGQVVIGYNLKIIGAPTAEQRKILEKFAGDSKTLMVTATDATTKIYKGISSWTAGEGRPTGLAAAVFAAATEQQYEGQVTTVQDEIPAGRWHGKKLALMNGDTTLVPNAVIHSASVDVETGRVTLEFGPMPYLAAGDFLDLQRILNRRQVTWYSQEERTTNTLGATSNGSAIGDNVGGFNFPQTTSPPLGALVPLQFQVTTIPDGEAWKAEVTAGWVRYIDPISGSGTPLGYWLPDTLGDNPAPQWTVSTDLALFCKVQTNQKGLPISVVIETAANGEQSTHYQPPLPDGGGEGVDGVYYYKIAEFQMVDDVLTPKQFQSGGPIIHNAELWLGKNLTAEDTERDYKVFKQRNNETDEYEFRGIQQLYAVGNSVLLKPADTEEPQDQIEVVSVDARYGLTAANSEDGEELVLDIEAENVGESGCDIYVVPTLTEGVPPDEKAKFRRVRGLIAADEDGGDDPQILVEYSTDGNSAVVRGNRKYGSRRFMSADGEEIYGEIEWVDGLVTSEGDEDVVLAGEGADLNLTINTFYEDTYNEPIGGTPPVTHYWRSGLYVGITAPEGDPPAGLIGQIITSFIPAS